MSFHMTTMAPRKKIFCSIVCFAQAPLSPLSLFFSPLSCCLPLAASCVPHDVPQQRRAEQSKANLINDFIVIFLFFSGPLHGVQNPCCPAHAHCALRPPYATAALRFMRILFLCVCASVCLGGWTCTSMVWAFFECQRNGCSDYQKLILLSAFVSHHLPHSPPLSYLHASAWSTRHFHVILLRPTRTTKVVKILIFPQYFWHFGLLATYVWQIKCANTHTHTQVLYMYSIYLILNMCLLLWL